MTQLSMMHTPKQNAKLLILLLILAWGLFISACAQAAPVNETELSATPSPGPTTTPTPAPLGSSANPIVLGFDISQDPQRTNTAARQTLADEISQLSGITIQIKEYVSAEDVYTAFLEGEVHLSWFHPLTYLAVHQKNQGTVGMLTNHFGTYFYGTQFLANVESGFVSYFDTSSNSSTGSAEDALLQLDGKRPCWVDPGSISGFILPAGILEQYNVETLAGVIVQNHTSVIRALYIKGICDFGATFSISGDPRTSSAITNDLPDAAGRVIVLWQTPADIPNLNLTYQNSLDDDARSAINQAFVTWIKKDGSKSTLASALGNYEVQDLQIVDDSIYDPLRQAVDLSGADVSAWIGR